MPKRREHGELGNSDDQDDRDATCAADGSVREETLAEVDAGSFRVANRETDRRRSRGTLSEDRPELLILAHDSEREATSEVQTIGAEVANGEPHDL